MSFSYGTLAKGRRARWWADFLVRVRKEVLRRERDSILGGVDGSVEVKGRGWGSRDV